MSVLLWIAACGVKEQDPAPVAPHVTEPAPPVPAPAPSEEGPAPALPDRSKVRELPMDAEGDQLNDEGAERVDWPLYRMRDLPELAPQPLPGQPSSLALDPRGRGALLVVEGRPMVWTPEAGLGPLQLSGWEGASLVELEWSPFRDALYAVARVGEGWELGRLRWSGGELALLQRLWQSEEPLGDLVAPMLTFNGRERIFYSRGKPGARQILSITAQGAYRYEVTSPSGALGTLTESSQFTEAAGFYGQPDPLKAADARPLSLDPIAGALRWMDGSGHLHDRDWNSWGEGDPKVPHDEHNNWGPSKARPTAAGELSRSTANGWYELSWRPGAPGARLKAAGEELLLARGDLFLTAPELSVNGRDLGGFVQVDGGPALVIRPVEPHWAAVRHARKAALRPEELDRLRKVGLSVAPWGANGSIYPLQLYGLYDELSYETERPTYATVDGMMEVAHAGFEAIFLIREAQVSAPALLRFAREMERAGGAAGIRRAAEVGRVTALLMSTDPGTPAASADPELQLVFGERQGQSEAHGRLLRIEDYRPRGPYSRDPALARYFRAFKYMNDLRLEDKELAVLGADAELVAAWRGWTSAQADFLFPGRRPGLFEAEHRPPPWAPPECMPASMEQQPRLVYPLSWGPDAEALERSVQHLSRDEAEALGSGRSWAEIEADSALQRMPAHCTVRDRLQPSGLDLLAVLGSPFARARSAAQLQKYPGLAAAWDRTMERLNGVTREGFGHGWLAMLSATVQAGEAPEAIAEEAWQARLAETALAAWATFRHTLVLVSELSAAQAGDGGMEGFEQLAVEPATAVVDPLPEVWEQLAAELELLARMAEGLPDAEAAATLRDAARDSRRLGELARRQMQGLPLRRADYSFIQHYSGTIEHPTVKLQALGDPEKGLREPNPVTRIVDVHSWTRADGGQSLLHAAVGLPQQAVVLLGDRGLLIPGAGATYSYHELVSDRPITDEEWRSEHLPRAQPLPWTNAARQARSR